MSETATDPNGIIHKLDAAGTTLCGRDAAGWSRAVTVAQLTGLALFCEACGE